MKQEAPYFENREPVLIYIAKRLRELNISYAVTGDLAMFFHGLERDAENLELLVSRESLSEIHQRVSGVDFMSAPSGNKDILDKANRYHLVFCIPDNFELKFFPSHFSSTVTGLRSETLGPQSPIHVPLRGSSAAFRKEAEKPAIKNTAKVANCRIFMPKSSIELVEE